MGYRILIHQGLPFKLWKKVRVFKNKEKALQYWEFIKQQLPQSKYRLKEGSKIIDKLN